MEILERDDALTALHHAVGEAAAGRGRVVLVTGEAGIGKTSLVRAFAADAHARVMLAACDDLRAQRPLGPLRDALDGADDMFAALLRELGREPPTLLIVEDVHWADDATLDVLAFAVRRIERLPSVLLLSFRDDHQQPLARLLSAVAGAPHDRLALAPLSREAVTRLGGSEALHRITGGNPFFVSEALAAPSGRVPASVADAVLARVARLSGPCRAALDQLSVLPSGADVLAPALAEAEAAGIVVGNGFRHEIARRAVEQSLPTLRRRALNQAAVRELRRSPAPDLARLMHHAAEAGDVATILEFGLQAAREASAESCHRQALEHLETLRPYAYRLPARERAEMLDEYGWELYSAHRFPDAVRAGREAADAFAELRDNVAAGGALIRLSRHLLLFGETAEAERCARRAAKLLELRGTDAEHAEALAQQGAILAMTGEAGAAEALEAASELAAGLPDLRSLCLNYLGIARNDPAPLRESIAIARGDEYIGRGYTNLAEVLTLTGALDELEPCSLEGLEFTRERGLWSHAYILEAHRCIALLRRGHYDEAQAGLRALVESVDDPGTAMLYSMPWYGRLLARRGHFADAEPLLVEAWERAQWQGLVVGLAYAGVAYAEFAWLTGDAELTATLADALRGRLPAHFRDELDRYVGAQGGAPEDDPYEHALATDDLETLERLGAEPAAEIVRARLRARGVRVPRAKPPANPAGLTARQLDVLALIDAGRTNAEIAASLGVSVRTVDHHVAAILEKLGVHSRREAAAAAARLGLRSAPPAGSAQT